MDFFCRTLASSSKSLSEEPFDAVEVTLALTRRDPEVIDVVSPKSHYAPGTARGTANVRPGRLGEDPAAAPRMPPRVYSACEAWSLRYAKLNPLVRYVQGMNELIAPVSLGPLLGCSASPWPVPVVEVLSLRAGCPEQPPCGGVLMQKQLGSLRRTPSSASRS